MKPERLPSGGCLSRRGRAEHLRSTPVGVLVLLAVGLALSGCATPSQLPPRDPSQPSGTAPTALSVASEPAQPSEDLRSEAVSTGQRHTPPTTRSAEPQPACSRPVGVEAPSPFGLVRGVGDRADRELAMGESALLCEHGADALKHFAQARLALPEHPAPLVGHCLAELVVADTSSAFGATDAKALAPFEASARRALELQPGYAPAQLLWGRLRLMAGEATEALPYLERAAAARGSDPESHSALGVAALALGEVERAHRHLQAATQLDPLSAARLSNLAATEVMLGDLDAASRTLKRALELAPDDARVNSDLGLVLLSMGRLEQAYQRLTRAHQLAPERATIMNNLGYAHQRMGELAVARTWYERALHADPALGSAWINLGVVFARSGDPEQARRAFQKALELDPTDPRALENLQDLDVRTPPEAGREERGGSPHLD